MQGVRVPCLVRELRFHMPCGMVWPKIKLKKRKEKKLPAHVGRQEPGSGLKVTASSFSFLLCVRTKHNGNQGWNH